MNKKYGIVTGASRGLGVGCAREIARQGMNVVITYYVQKEKAEKVAETFRKDYGVEIAVCQFSAEVKESAENLIKIAVETFGENLAVLVNNEGIHRSGQCVDMEPEEYEHVLRVNTMGTYNVCHYAIPYMIKNHYGRIINMCSAVGLRGWQGASAYSSSKFAIRGLTQCLALELGEHNITVNAIAPGTHNTEMTQEAPAESIKKRLEMNPLHRMGEVTEMDKLVRYFIESDFINGQVVSPNGGTTMI